MNKSRKILSDTNQAIIFMCLQLAQTKNVMSCLESEEFSDDEDGERILRAFIEQNAAIMEGLGNICDGIDLESSEWVNRVFERVREFTHPAV